MILKFERSRRVLVRYIRRGLKYATDSWLGEEGFKTFHARYFLLFLMRNF